MSEMKVARMETWGGSIPVVVGWELRGDCGCMALEGMRLDKPGPRDLQGEPVIGFYPCDRHKSELESVRTSFVSDMPEPDRPLHDVLVERFHRAIEESK